MPKSRRPRDQRFPPGIQKPTLDKIRFGQAQIRRAIEKGDKNEQRFIEAVQILIQRGEVFTYYHAKPKGELNNDEAIDALVFTSPSRATLFQVKSSERGKEDHYTTYGARIRCVVVDPFITPDALADRIKDEIEEVILEELADVYRKQRTTATGPD